LKKIKRAPPQGTTIHDNSIKIGQQDARRHAEGKHAPHDQKIGIMQKQPKFSTKKNPISHWCRNFSPTPKTPTGEKTDTGGTRRHNGKRKKKTRRQRISKIDLAKCEVRALQEMAKKHHIATSGIFFHRKFSKRLCEMTENNVW